MQKLTLDVTDLQVQSFVIPGEAQANGTVHAHNSDDTYCDTACASCAGTCGGDTCDGSCDCHSGGTCDGTCDCYSAGCYGSENCWSPDGGVTFYASRC